jgi:hypothetical protein
MSKKPQSGASSLRWVKDSRKDHGSSKLFT